MQKIKFGHFAIIFGVCGIALLYVVSEISQPIQLSNYEQIAKHEGEAVSVEGTLLDLRFSDNNELFCTIYNHRQLIDVIVEGNIDPKNLPDINSILHVAGRVEKNFRGEFEIVVTDIKDLKVIGQYNPPELDWTDLDIFNNSYIQTEGTVIGSEEYYGGDQKLILKNGSNRIEAILEFSSSNFDIGNNVKIFGVIKTVYSGYRIYIYNPASVSITGNWKIEGYNLIDLTKEPEKFTDYPVYLKGYVLYEPYSNPAFSINIGEEPKNSRLNIRVDLSDIDKEVELHKGDAVSMLAYTAYEKNSMKFYLMPRSIEVTTTHGAWDINLEDLAVDYFEYERALLNLTGYLLGVENELYLCDRSNKENSTIKLKIDAVYDKSADLTINNDDLNTNASFDSIHTSLSWALGEKLTLRGRLTYRSELFIYVFSPEPNPSLIFSS